MGNILQECQIKLDNLRVDFARVEVDILRQEAGLIKLDKFSVKWHQSYEQLNHLYQHRSKITLTIADLRKDIQKLPLSIF